MVKSRAKDDKPPSTQPEKPALSVPQRPGENNERSAARAMLRPDVQAGATLLCYNKDQPDLTLDGLVSELSAQCEAATKGDLTRSEALLTSQAHTLDSLFHSLARRANGAQYLGQMEAFLRLSLKAQSQCRATIETLAEIKNPRAVAFVTQANIAHGPQQVNNAVLRRRRARGIWSPPRRAGNRKRAEQTFGACTWRTAGHPSDGAGSRG